ncbi:hypothetical protein AYI72_13560 [Shewanella algae]|jgi:hypothetical protein|uniref:hypothetical protein n=2 Tax=Shewanella algae TaxID=38313 RepID=UPI0011820954|nr:hypothetical protein [Shewanella algae]MBC8796154.1 hypothetical protein [Shewanella algae]MBO2625644.1 hypothetical protein [Shewanella algae]TVL02248.1 hypothetical protein AYI72_13560 [Shewanella algae]BCV29289.1 hypothetical protein TUM3811_31490 [Shewanella algae]
MDNHSRISLWVSIVALMASFVTGYFQYQSWQDAVEENLKIELKMLFGKSPLNPLDLRMISGVEERSGLEAALLVTNMGSTTARIVEAGYQDRDFPLFAFYAGANEPKVLAPGEQVLFVIPDVIKISRQLTDNVLLGAERNAKIFATSTKGNRFEALAIIEVAK